MSDTVEGVEGVEGIKTGIESNSVVGGDYESYTSKKRGRRYLKPKQDRIIDVHAFLKRSEYDRIVKEYDEKNYGFDKDGNYTSIGRFIGDCMIKGFELFKKEDITIDE